MNENQRNLKPLKEFICDHCGEIINDIGNGYVTWTRDEKNRPYHFMIVHKITCDDKPNYQSRALSDLLGHDGISILTSFMSHGIIRKEQGHDPCVTPQDIDEFIDFFRRLTVPYYEEARTHFRNVDVREAFAGDNEIRPYTNRILLDIIQMYN